MKRNLLATVSVLIALASVGFTAATYVDQHNADQAAGTAAERQYASKVSFWLQQIPHHSQPEMMVENQSLGPIRNINLWVPVPDQQNVPRSEGGAEVWVNLPDMPPCTIGRFPIISLVTAFRLRPVPSMFDYAGLTFSDANGMFWTRLGNGVLLNEARPKQTAGFRVVPDQTKRTTGCS